MNIPIYQIDAFASRVFSGNPAAVCVLEEWLDDSILQSIAQENNLSETAFIVHKERGAFSLSGTRLSSYGSFQLRWFTPVAEVDLCGHATLATGHVILNILEPSKDQVDFSTRSGKLIVSQRDDLLFMDFPAQPPVACEAPDVVLEGLGRDPVEVLKTDDYFVVFESEAAIRELSPNFYLLNQVDSRGIIATAKGDEVDFVSRFFAPQLGIPEDPVTGSAHTVLTPYWSTKLGKKNLHAHQLSARGGELFCEDNGDRIVISGRTVKYMEGVLDLPE